jgi:hypothetical protein
MNSTVAQAHADAIGLAVLGGAPGFVVRFGRHPGRDVDLFAVIEHARTSHCESGALDLLVTSRTECSQLVSLRDPLVCEPLSTGHLVAGDRDVFTSISLKLNAPPELEQVVAHLSKTGIEYLLHARRWLMQFSNDGEASSALGCVMNLAYSCSCLLPVPMYSRGRITYPILDELTSLFPFLQSVRATVARIKSREVVPSGDLDSLLRHWELKAARGAAEIA